MIKLLAALVVLLGIATASPASAQPGTCDQHVIYDASTNGSTKLVTGVAGQRVYICGFLIQIGSTATTVKLISGTGIACATGTSNPALSPAYQLIANTRGGYEPSAYWEGTRAAAVGDDVCIFTNAGNAVQADLWYTIQP